MTAPTADTKPYTRMPTGFTRARTVMEAFTAETGMPCRLVPAGDGFDLAVPVEYLERQMVAVGAVARERR